MFFAHFIRGWQLINLMLYTQLQRSVSAALTLNIANETAPQIYKMVYFANLSDN